jgi:hypothetical protein
MEMFTYLQASSSASDANLEHATCQHGPEITKWVFVLWLAEIF